MKKLIYKYKNIEGMKLDDKDGLSPYLYWERLKKENFLLHGFSTRLGGVSRGIYRSMNLSFTNGDDKECVLENYKRISKAIGFPYESIVSSDQTHTVNVKRVGKADRGHGILHPKTFFDVDGMITNDRDVILATSYADCVPLFIVDKKHRAIGLSHSGWRGTVGKIGKVTIEKMAEEFGSSAKDLLVGIGPSICVDCYEVSQDVAEKFIGAFDDTTSIVFPKENGKYQLDLWEANRKIFLESGVLEENILLSNLCTFCNQELLFSHRASKGKRGNLQAFLGIR